MVKVKDTASFIQSAIEVHGDRYDYSQTVWSGSHNPIIIICKVCGPITLASSASHYNKQKSGCGKCNHMAAMNRKRKHDPPRKCIKCGRTTVKCSGLCALCSPKITHENKILADKRRIEKKARQQELMNRPCKGCGKPVNSLDKRQVRCGLNCPGFKVQVKCCVCDKSIAKYKLSVREKNCCSLECQRKYALETNRGRRNHTSRSLARLKSEWYSKRRSERKKKSVGRKFWSIANRGIDEQKPESEWGKKCTNAIQTMGQRLTYVFVKKTRATTFEQVAARFDVTGGRYNRLNIWEKKCYSTAKNLKSKRRLRNVRRLSSLSIGSTKAQPRQLSLWE